MDFEEMHPNDDGWSDWVHPLPGYLMKCCDCGLVHEMQVAITPSSTTVFNDGEDADGVVIFRMRRPPAPTVVLADGTEVEAPATTPPTYVGSHWSVSGHWASKPLDGPTPPAEGGE